MYRFRKKVLLILLPAVFCLGAPYLSAQSFESYLHKGDSLHCLYRFEDALAQYMGAFRRAGNLEQKSLVDRKIDQSQNALSMTDFCARPEVVARDRYSVKDFFLYYPMENRSWRIDPNPLDYLSTEISLYFPDKARSVIFSAADATGARNLYRTENLDTCWSAPEPLDERLTSSGNEIFPVLSSDGNTLWFASDGLPGMGGYDLYVSRRDPASGSWSEPANLGIPFSSPGDDFLLLNTDDGECTIFASNRDCSKDSVYIYVLEYDPLPVMTPVHSAEELKELSSLRPPQNSAATVNIASAGRIVTETDNTKLYRARTEQSRALRDSIYRYENDLDALRGLFSQAEGETRELVTRLIREKEEALIPIRKELEAVSAEIRSIEQNFLKGGVVGSRPTEAIPRGESRPRYSFRRNSAGTALKIKLKQRESDSSEAFSISPIGHFADVADFPLGTVWQIRLMSNVRHATLDDIHGLSPVYERLSSNLKYTCYAGVFRSYAAAMSQLNKVRALGFTEARIVVWQDGKSADVATMRSQQPQRP